MGIFGVNRNPASEGIMKCLLNKMVKDGLLKKAANTWIISSHIVNLTDEDKKQIKFVEVFHKNYAMNTPLMSELIPKAYKFGITEEKLNQIILYLVRQGRLYNIDNNYLYKDIVDNCRKILLEFLMDDDGLTVAQFRDLVKGNRKICLLLLAQYDREGIIFREGDLRYLTDKGRNWYKQRYAMQLAKSEYQLPKGQVNKTGDKMENWNTPLAGRKKILMIDDDVNLVNVIKMVLESKNYEFTPAYSAAEGLEKIIEFNPDLIILDVIMEDFVAGFRVVSELRTGGPDSKYSAYSGIPILMLTSVTSKTNFSFSEKVGTALLPIDVFMEKPVKPVELLSKIEELLMGHPNKI
jgi:CheY-like chemotaxis protein